MLVEHVPPPVVFSGEGFAALSRVRAFLLCAVKLARLAMLVVDVAVQVCLCSKLHLAARMWALVRSLVVSLMMIQLVDLVENAITLCAREDLVQSSW